MIRVLHIGMSNNLGGIENFVMNLYRNIDKTKIQFDFIDLIDSNIYFYDEILRNGGKTYKVIPRRKNIYKNYMQLKKIICENNYKVIHFHINTLSYIAPIILCNKLKDVKIIVHSHSKWNNKSLKTLLLHKINYYRIKNKKMVKCACSVDAAKWIFGDSEDVIIINNGIDVNRFKYDKSKRDIIRKQNNIKNNEILIGHIGRFTKEKNHKFLIDVFNMYRKNNPSKLMLLGSGYLDQDIKKQIKELNLEEKVLILGDKLNVEDYYNAMDIFVFPSLYEGLGMVLIEAQINGLKCIASNFVPNEANVTGKVDFLPIDNGNEIWLQELSKNDFKRYDEIAKIRKNGYDIKQTVEKIKKIYIDLEKEI